MRVINVSDVSATQENPENAPIICPLSPRHPLEPPVNTSKITKIQENSKHAPPALLDLKTAWGLTDNSFQIVLRWLILFSCVGGVGVLFSRGIIFLRLF